LVVSALGISNSANLLTQPVVTVLIGLPAAVIDGRRPVAVVCVFLVEMQYITTGTRHYADGPELCRRLFVGAVGVAH
jgi:hypothetical protein